MVQGCFGKKSEPAGEPLEKKTVGSEGLKRSTGAVVQLVQLSEPLGNG